jgi:hypothetical protein
VALHLSFKVLYENTKALLWRENLLETCCQFYSYLMQFENWSEKEFESLYHLIIARRIITSTNVD